MIQARYGWTDNQVNSLPFQSFQNKLNILYDREKSERTQRNASVASLAYLAWQYGMSKGQSFEQHLQNLGLLERKPLTQEEKKQMVEKALEDSRKIISMLSRRKKAR